MLTFLAGAEVDPDDFRERLGASLAIGVVSFVGPFVVASLIALGPLGWSFKASLIAGTALSTTSLAVVYAVLVETGHRGHFLGTTCSAPPPTASPTTPTARSWSSDDHRRRVARRR